MPDPQSLVFLRADRGWLWVDYLRIGGLYFDIVASWMIQTLRTRRLRVPDDFAVRGLNNLAIADLTLTTID